MKNAFICDAIRTPVGKYGGSLSPVRPDDLMALVIKSLIEKNPDIDCIKVDDVIIGCANQAGEDNRNVARMALLLSGLPETVSGATINRLCGSGMDTIGMAARMIQTGDADLIIAGGVESMSRAPFVMQKSNEAFSRKVEVYDTTIGWRFVNEKLKSLHGVDSMIETAENLAKEFDISREAQDLFAHNSQLKTNKAQREGLFKDEIISVSIPQKKSAPIIVDVDEHPRLSTLEKLSFLKPIVSLNGTVTAGNSSGVNDGACGLIIASESAIKKYKLKPLAKILGMQTAGVAPRTMGIGPVPATNKLLNKLQLKIKDFDVIELNEAFASQSLACLSSWGVKADDERVNKQGGAIAIGHPLGMSGARIVTTAVHQLQREKSKLALCTMCIGVGQGIAMVVERV